MNAFELNDAAFDRACEYAEETIEYVQGYAEGCFGIIVPDEIAQKILDCRAACRAYSEINGWGQDNTYQMVQAPLEAIEL